ncbi:MAG TPA: hypothetical protein VM243_14550, partial [Phycisphaerae bacterium]|nr:hypothetical protein [Phycisphaerae bacterium]
MNFKTTLYLAVALVVVVGLAWLVGLRESGETGLPPKVTELLTDKSLIAEDFGQVVKLTCARRDGEEWVF